MPGLMDFIARLRGAQPDVDVRAAHQRQVDNLMSGRRAVEPARSLPGDMALPSEGAQDPRLAGAEPLVAPATPPAPDEFSDLIAGMTERNARLSRLGYAPPTTPGSGFVWLKGGR